MAEFKTSYDQDCKRKRWDPKNKKWVQPKPKEGYATKAVRKYYKDLKDLPSTDKRLKSAIEFARRSFAKYGNSENIEEEPSKKRFRSEGGGRKAHAPEFRDELYEWFIGMNFSILRL